MNVLGIESPYLIALTGRKTEFGEYVDRTKTIPGLVLKTLNGKKMKDWSSAMDEIATQLEFPTYFGKNGPALSECLRDLDEWLPGDAYLIVLYDAIAVLNKETHADAISFFNLLDRICGEWAIGTLPGANWERKQTPFHILLCGDSADIEKLTRRLQPEISHMPVIDVSHAMHAQ